MLYKKHKLKNGLQIITVPMKGTQTVSVIVAIKVGSRHERENEAGLSHFIEHMLFKGTKNRPTSLDISEELDSLGGEFNAFTSKDATCYFAKVDSKHAETALDVVSDIYLNAKLDVREIEKEKGTIIQELNMYEDNPMRDIGNVFENLLYEKNPLGRKIIGSNDAIVSFKRKNLVDYMKRFYVANDTKICIAGKFDEGEIMRQVKRYFNRMAKGKISRIKKVFENQKYPQAKPKFKKTDQTHFILGNRAYNENHKDRFALSLLSVILGGNMSSRLFMEVREKRGLAYYVKTDFEAYEDCGFVATQAGVEHKNLPEAIKIILQEYRKIASEKISEKELKKAKEFIKGKSIMNLESSDEVAMFFITQLLKEKKITTISEKFKFIDKVTASDILRVAKDIFRKEKLNLAVIGPHKNKKELEKFLKL